MGKGPNICKIEGCDRTCNRYPPPRSDLYETTCGACKATLRKYGISTVEREELLISQDRKCKLCSVEVAFYDGRKVDIPTARGALDHCHTTGVIRGVLCSKCNMGLGLFKDNIETMEKAIAYLHKSKL